MQEHVKIFTGHSVVVNRIASLLDENNIPNRIKDNVESARVAGFGTQPISVELWVYEEDVEKAREIVKAFESQG